MKVYFLIMNAYSTGGTIRTTFTTASALAEHHDVEIVSVYRRRNEPRFDLDPRVRLRALSDESPERRQRLASDRRPHRQLQRLLTHWLRWRPSRLIFKGDVRHPNFSLLTDVKLYRFLRSVRDGVLISTRPGLNLAVARWARPGVVRVAQEHLYVARYKPPLRERISRHYPHLDMVSALTERDAEDYRSLLGDSTRIVCMPNAVPDNVGARASGDSKVVISAGRLTRQKGFDRLIPAFAKVAAEHPGWKLRIFGSGELREQLQKQIDDLELQDNVELMGFTDQLYQEMSGAAMYVMSSRFEGFPMVLLEAMGCGLPVVSFDCPNGPRDLVTEGVDGLIVDNGDIDGLTAAISTLISDDERRQTMGRAALKTAEQYASGVLGAKWERLLTELAAGKR